MNTLSAILWNPDIEIFSIFGISIRYYSVLFVTGLSLAYWVIYKLYQDQKIPYKIKTGNVPFKESLVLYPSIILYLIYN